MRTIGRWLRIPVFTVCALCLPRLSVAQNVSAHYADGQVWIIWDVDPAIYTNFIATNTLAISNNVSASNDVQVSIPVNLPQTYAIWTSPNPITNTATAALLGRSFSTQWEGQQMKNGVNLAFGFRPDGYAVPDGNGGVSTLATNQGLFVHTVRSNFTAHYAVRPWGQTNVPSAWRSGPVTALYSTNQPPHPQVQARGKVANYPLTYYTLWVDGAQDENSGRPDFPILANANCHGIAHNFYVMEPKPGITNVIGTNLAPATMLLHSGEEDATMWLPNGEAAVTIGLAPTNSLIISQEDKLWQYRNGTNIASNTRWLGWAKGYDPFTDVVSDETRAYLFPDPSQYPANDDVVVPYTLRRLAWILDWCIANHRVDPVRVSVMGHSGGSMGGLLFSKAFPNRVSSAVLFGTGLGDYPNTRHTWKQFGQETQNLVVITMTNHSGGAVHTRDIFEPNSSLAPQRDGPITRIFVGRREDNWVADADHDGVADVMQRIKTADTNGTGLAFYWDLRQHGMEYWPYNVMTNLLGTNIPAGWTVDDYWVPFTTNQIRRDDATYNVRYHASQSYPAFFHLSGRAGHGDMGTVVYTNNTVPDDGLQPYDGLVVYPDDHPPVVGGDDRGTWGGWFDWDVNTLADTATNWACDLWLVNGMISPDLNRTLETCPTNQLVADVAVRKPQAFLPAPATLMNWELRSVNSGNLLRSGTSVVDADGLVAATNLTIQIDPARARLTFTIAVAPALCTPTPTLCARLLTNASLELRWFACTDYDYQLESSPTLTNWSNAGPPYPAPPGGGWLTNAVIATNGYTFFRVRADPLTNSPVPAAPGIYTNLFFTADGLLRSYRLMVPTNYNPASNAFALILHGHGQTANSFAALHPGLFVSAQTNNLILALPNGIDDVRGTGWNSDDPNPGEYQVNDVSFLLGLINHLDATLTLDRHRLYAGGFSAGSVMCHYLGARTTNVFAALAVIEGSIGSDKGTGVIITNPSAAGPMPVLMVNATNDCARPYWGGPNDEGTLITPAIAAAYYWTNANLCAAAMTATTNNIVTSNIGRFNACGAKPPATNAQPNQVIIQHWAACSPGIEVIFVTLTDGGHEWQNAGDHVGWDSNAEVPKFFLQHVKP